ncbi:MAG: type III-B CRISPR module-associated protein Cmr5 [Thermocladium sp.]
MGFLDLAIEIAKKLNSLKNECGDGESSIEGYARRAVDFPSLMLQGGLASAMSFYLSKSDITKVFHYFNYWQKGEKPKMENKSDKKGSNRYDLCDDMGKESSKGYSAFMGSLLYILANSGKQECNLENEEKVGSSILECLTSLEQEEVRIEKKITPILIKLKELSEMLSPRKEGENNEQ